MTVVQLRAYAREKKVRLPYGVNKAKLVELLNHELREEQKEEESGEIGLYKPKPLGFYDEEYGTSNPVVPKMLKAGLLAGGRGVLEVQPGGYDAELFAGTGRYLCVDCTDSPIRTAQRR